MKRFSSIIASPWQTRIDKGVLGFSLVLIGAALIAEHIILKGSL